MKLFCPLMVAGAITVLGLAPPPAGAQPPAEWVGHWELEVIGRGICVAERIHPDGTEVWFFAYPDGDRMLTLINHGWPKPSGGPYRLVSLRGRERVELKGKATNEIGLVLGAGPAARVVASDAIEVVRPDNSLVAKVDFSGIAAVAARLPACMARAAEIPMTVVPAPMAPPPPASLELNRLGTPARAKVDLQALFTDLDYPSAAVRADEHGTVAFQLVIGTSGRVTGCMISASSGSESLDSTTCRVMAERAVFEPARDPQGRPAIGVVKARVVWTLPQPDPPPPPR